MVVLASGCGNPLNVYVDSRFVESGGATSSNVEVRASKASVTITSLAGEGIMTANFSYTDIPNQPLIDYKVAAGKGTLIVKEPSDVVIQPNGVYEWALKFNQDTPLNMSLMLGEGVNNINAGGLKLTDLYLNIKGGKTTLDLRGVTVGLNPRVKTEGGKLTIRLPSDLGVKIRAEEGFESITADGLSRNGNTYVNSLWDTAKENFEVELRISDGQVIVLA